MSIAIIFYLVTFGAIFMLYRYIERRLNDIESRLSNHQNPEANDDDNYLNRISKKIDVIKEMCAPLLLLNIFDENINHRVDDDVDLTWLISDLEKAEENRISIIGVIDKTERAELEQQEKEHPNKKDFAPSEDLKSAILSVSAAILVKQTIYKQLQAIKEVFFDVVNGKVSIREARKKAIGIANRHGYWELKNTMYLGGSYDLDSIDKETDLAPEIKKEFKEVYSMHAERWPNGKWKERLKWYREMDKYEEEQEMDKYEEEQEDN